MDVIDCLTVGRGGRFRRDQGDVEYVPGGGEPTTLLYSRSGVPCRARPLVTSFEISYDPLVFTAAAIDELRERRGGPRSPLDFETDVMPLILTEMRIAYRRCQARCAEPGAEQALVAELKAMPAAAMGARLDELDAQAGRFDAAAAWDGPAGMRLGDGASYQRWFSDVLRRDLGLQGFAWSPAKAALDILRELRDTVGYTADFGGLTSSSADDFYRRVVPLMNRAVVGPQYERHAELRALMAAGIVRVPLGIRWTRPGGPTSGSGCSVRCAKARRSTTTWSRRLACTRARWPTPTAASPRCSRPSPRNAPRRPQWSSMPRLAR